MNIDKTEEGSVAAANDDRKEDEIVDSISFEGMDLFAEVCAKVIKPGGHGINFCSHLQFHICFYKLLSKHETVPDMESDPDGNVQKMENLFHVEPVPLSFLKRSSAYVCLLVSDT